MAMMTSTSRNCDCEGEDYDSNDGGGDNTSYKGSCGNVMIVYYECGGDYDSDSDKCWWW